MRLISIYFSNLLAIEIVFLKDRDFKKIELEDCDQQKKSAPL